MDSITIFIMESMSRRQEAGNLVVRGSVTAYMMYSIFMLSYFSKELHELREKMIILTIYMRAKICIVVGFQII